jgi:hypothetical protein
MARAICARAPGLPLSCSRIGIAVAAGSQRSDSCLEPARSHGSASLANVAEPAPAEAQLAPTEEAGHEQRLSASLEETPSQKEPLCSLRPKQIT